MAFGFLGDIVEGIGDVILGPSGGGQRGSKIGSAIGGTFGGSTGAAFGSAIGSQLSQAVSSPTPNQSPQYAAESGLSGVGTGPITQQDYRNLQAGRQIITGGFPTVYRPSIPQTAIETGIGAAMDIIPDINITKFFGGNGCGQAMPKLVGMTRDGCPTVTRKQQRVLRNMAQYMPLENVAYEAGVDVTTMARLISKTFPTRSKGISGAQLKTANRVNNKILSMAHRLGYDCKPMTTMKRGCK